MPRPEPSATTSRNDRARRRSLVAMTAVVATLNVTGWGVLLLVVAPRDYPLGDTGVLDAGLGITVFLLGARHAFDADHIAAIDNTTRKLVGDGRPAAGVGFWFSLGHSSVVFLLALLIALGVEAVAGPVRDDDSQLQQTLGIVGPAVAGTYLLLIGTTNCFAAASTARLLARVRTGSEKPEELASSLDNRGLLTRVLGRLMGRVRKPWHMYPVGLLMGLGFDTATQVAMLVLAAGSAAFALPWYAVLVLPVLFAAGMTLFDTVDGVVMARAYGWAIADPVRNAFYNLVITVLSVVAALGLGTLVLVQLAVDELGLTTGPLGWAGSLETEYAGYLLVALLVGTWLGCLALWRRRR